MTQERSKIDIRGQLAYGFTALPIAGSMPQLKMNWSNFSSLLCCPSCRGHVEYHDGEQEFFCPSCRFTFPIIEDIPVLFPCNVKEKFDQLFTRHWDPESRADHYDTNVEGAGDAFGINNHQAEVYGLTQHYDPSNLDLILDAGCGNGRFFETFPEYTVKLGVDASLNLLRRTKRRGRGDFLVCAELEHLPFKDETFSTVISCRVLQHLRQQEAAVMEIARVTREKGDVILELYNTWNLKTLYKQIRMSRNLRRVLNAPFRLLFRSMSPFGDWGLEYDRYNGWFQVKRWMRQAHLCGFTGRGVGFGYHKYLLEPLYIDALMEKNVPKLRRRYYDVAFRVERAIGGIVPFRYGMEKFVIKASKNTSERERTIATKLADKIAHVYKSSDYYNAAARKERNRELRRQGLVVDQNRFHIKEAIEWLKRAQDATPDRGVARGYSVGWTPFQNVRGWQPSYPETTGYIIPTFFDCAEYLGDRELRPRALEMADWEIDVQLENGAVRGGTIQHPPSPAIFNTGQVMLGWLRAYDETAEFRYLNASARAACYLLETQLPDGSWPRGNSAFAVPWCTTYNARVGWALILHGQRVSSDRYIEAGRKCLAYTMAQQRPNGWFEKNCLSDPSAPLTHTICYAMEGLLGGYEALGERMYLDRVLLAADKLLDCVPADGGLSGRFDGEWKPNVPWSCLSGNAQFAGVLLKLFAISKLSKYKAGAEKLLAFLKSTQNCVSRDDGLRGGVKGSHPFDGEYGPYEVLNWATKFFIDALLLHEGRSVVHESSTRVVGGGNYPS